jgi:hypothetical protein
MVELCQRALGEQMCNVGLGVSYQRYRSAEHDTSI